MENEDIRWEQRFANYKKALSKLTEIIENRFIDDLTDLEKEGMIQRFEYSFELAWKTLQDLLKAKGINDIIGPNSVIAQSFQEGYILDSTGWREMMKARNLSSHTYNAETAEIIVKQINDTFYLLFIDLEKRMEVEKGKNQII